MLGVRKLGIRKNFAKQNCTKKLSTANLIKIFAIMAVLGIIIIMFKEEEEDGC